MGGPVFPGTCISEAKRQLHVPGNLLGWCAFSVVVERSRIMPPDLFHSADRWYHMSLWQRPWQVCMFVIEERSRIMPPDLFLSVEK